MRDSPLKFVQNLVEFRRVLSKSLAEPDQYPVGDVEHSFCVLAWAVHPKNEEILKEVCMLSLTEPLNLGGDAMYSFRKRPLL